MESPPSTPSPPRAYSQGVGTVFQFVGVIMFLVMMFICCGSGLLSKDVATHSNLSNIGWKNYSAQRALTINVFAGVLFGMALVCAGLGLQMHSRRAALGGVILCGAAECFYLIQMVFAAQQLHSIILTFFGAVAVLLFAVLWFLAYGAVREMHRNPPPPDLGVLPADYKIPYSHYHDDPPEIRMARELEQRRQKLAVQQKELEMLEEKLKKQLEEKKDV